MSGNRTCDGVLRAPKSKHGVLPRTTCGSFHPHPRHAFDMNDDAVRPHEADAGKARAVTMPELAKEIYEDLAWLRASLSPGAEGADEALQRLVRRMLRASVGGTMTAHAMTQALTNFERDNYPLDKED
jgi:hypothetical protein